MRNANVKRDKRTVAQNMRDNLPALFKDICRLAFRYRLIFAIKIVLKRYN